MKKNSKKDQQIEYRDLSYPAKRHDLRELALKSEIANCVDTVTDDIYSCLNMNMIVTEDVNRHLLEETISRANISWNDVKSYLVDGFLSNEIILVDSDPVSLVSLDPSSLIPNNEDKKKVWIQYPNDQNMKRVLFDSQVTYVSYSNVSVSLSYVESLRRPYEQLKLAEDLYVASKLSMPGIDPSVSLTDIEYFTYKFNQASRLRDSSGAMEEDKIRYQKFIHKHALNLINNIYLKMHFHGLSSTEIKLKPIR